MKSKQNCSLWKLNEVQKPISCQRGQPIGEDRICPDCGGRVHLLELIGKRKSNGDTPKSD
jgi:rRNA maturation endonuclease Nob1